jgi:SRSO17 transposase
LAIGERPLPGRGGESKWFVNDFSIETQLTEMACIAYERWHIERFYQDAKTELGFDYYEGCSWIGLHLHLTLVMLANTWLLLQDGSDENAESIKHPVASV